MTDTACVEDFVLARDEYHVNPLFIHSIYLINLASADPLLVRRSRSSLQATLEVAALMGASGVVTLDREIGLDRLALIHANDSARPCGSRRDRHANIGGGHIGLEGFRQLLVQPTFRQVPWILETPDLERRVDDLTILHALSVGSLPATERPAYEEFGLGLTGADGVWSMR